MLHTAILCHILWHQLRGLLDLPSDGGRVVDLMLTSHGWVVEGAILVNNGGRSGSCLLYLHPLSPLRICLRPYQCLGLSLGLGLSLYLGLGLGLGLSLRLRLRKSLLHGAFAPTTDTVSYPPYSATGGGLCWYSQFGWGDDLENLGAVHRDLVIRPSGLSNTGLFSLFGRL